MGLYVLLTLSVLVLLGALSFDKVENLGSLAYDPDTRQVKYVPPAPKTITTAMQPSVSRATRNADAYDTSTNQVKIAPPAKPPALTQEEEVTDRDLSFQQWAIEQTGDKLFCVTNKLDRLEKYNVFLGDPVGCTCGIQGCEHILAVLKS